MTPKPKDDCKHSFTFSMEERFVKCFKCDLRRDDWIRQQTAQEIQDIIIKVIRLRPDLMNDLSWRFSRLIEEEIKQKYFKEVVK